MKILGIDPGLRKTGFGVISIKNNTPSYIASGVITTESDVSLALRLKDILSGLTEVIANNQPDIVSIEKVFVNTNPQSTLLLGQARGAAISACVLKNLTVSEYTALQIKQSVVGYGHATKEQINKMVKYSLKLEGKLPADAADGLAVALTHFYFANFSKKLNLSSAKAGRLIK